MAKSGSRFWVFFKFYVLAVPWIGLAGFVLTRDLKQLHLARASLKWPAVQKMVQRSYLDSWYGRRSGSSTYFARVSYSFEVDGTTYSSQIIEFPDGSNGFWPRSNPAKKMLDLYPARKVVTVYYMPGNPSVCCLKPGLDERVGEHLWVHPFVAGVILLFGCFYVGVVALLQRADSARERASQ